MLEDAQKEEISEIVDKALDDAEKVWSSHGRHIAIDARADEAVVKRAEVLPSKIPSHPFVSGDNPKVERFIALVADMRKSSEHLLCAISKEGAKVSQLQRVYYETSALLPALEQTIRYENGSVTEYLGDGVLALFKVDKANPKKAIYSAYDAAENCKKNTRTIVNQAIAQRYNLPAIDLGIGLAMSDALVSLVGLEGQRHPKAFGKCVYYATKLSFGTNQIHIDDVLHQHWPTSKDGGLRFVPKKAPKTEIEGYLIARE